MAACPQTGEGPSNSSPAYLWHKLGYLALWLWQFFLRENKACDYPYALVGLSIHSPAGAASVLVVDVALTAPAVASYQVYFDLAYFAFF